MKTTKRIVAVLAAMVLCALCLFGCSDKNGDGTTTEPTVISVKTAEELFACGQYVGKEYANYILRLDADIDLSAYTDGTGKTVDWKPIGVTLGRAFMGTLDGNGHKIIGLTVTGWDDVGTPKTIAKRILGWKADGTPVYQSQEIIRLDRKENGEVTDLMYEGDFDSADYEDASDNGVIEETTAFGSVGLFGYTKNATIKNVVFENADISFYSSGEYTYAGVVSGYDYASTFDNVTVQNCKINVSSIYTHRVFYHTSTAKPSRIKEESDTTQYLGGLVGYAKAGNVSASNGATLQNSIFKNVLVKNIVVDNFNYSAAFDGGLTVDYYEAGNEDSYYLKTSLTEGNGSYVAHALKEELNDFSMPKQAFVGGVAGYMDRSTVTDTTVDGFNNVCDLTALNKKVTESDRTASKLADKKQTTTEICGSDLTAGGISSYFAGGTVKNSSVKNAYLNASYWQDVSNIWSSSAIYSNTDKALVVGKASLGGLFAVAEKGTVEHCTVEKTYLIENGSQEAENICMGGILSFAFGRSNIKDVSVKDVLLSTNYKKSGEVAAVLGGAVGVVRDSTVTGTTVENGKFEITSGSTADLLYTDCLVAQVYGQSNYYENSATACKTVLNGTETDFETVQPLIGNNKYVNEDGEDSVRLYYSPSGTEYANVFVTVYGALTELDIDGKKLYPESVCVRYDGNELLKNDTEVIDNGTYYVYESSKGEWYQINLNTAEMYKTYDANRLYATSRDVYRVEVPEEKVGQAMTEGATYYEYENSTGSLTQTADRAYVSGKTYYLLAEEAVIDGYLLEVSVYTESDDLIETLTYTVSVAQFAAAPDTYYDVYNTEKPIEERTGSVICSAERFLSVFFSVGEGFKADMNGKTLVGTNNRDYAKYIFIDGRPTVDKDTNIVIK